MWLSERALILLFLLLKQQIPSEPAQRGEIYSSLIPSFLRGIPLGSFPPQDERVEFGAVFFLSADTVSQQKRRPSKARGVHTTYRSRRAFIQFLVRNFQLTGQSHPADGLHPLRNVRSAFAHCACSLSRGLGVFSPGGVIFSIARCYNEGRVTFGRCFLARTSHN